MNLVPASGKLCNNILGQELGITTCDKYVQVSFSYIPISYRFK